MQMHALAVGCDIGDICPGSPGTGELMISWADTYRARYNRQDGDDAYVHHLPFICRKMATHQKNAERLILYSSLWMKRCAELSGAAPAGHSRQIIRTTILGLPELQ